MAFGTSPGLPGGEAELGSGPFSCAPYDWLRAANRHDSPRAKLGSVSFRRLTGRAAYWDISVRHSQPARDQVTPDTPLRLDTAAALAFPDGSMTVSGLRREAARGRLHSNVSPGKTILRCEYRTHEGAMPRRSKGARLWLRERCGRSAQWIIRDGNHQKGTGCASHDIVGAERALATYIASKHVRRLRRGSRDPDQIPIADVLTIYLNDIVPRHSRPDETKGRIRALDAFFGDRTLSYVKGETCRAYASQRTSDAPPDASLRTPSCHQSSSTRRSMRQIVEVVLPLERPPRERWLTRPEAARLSRQLGDIAKSKRASRQIGGPDSTSHVSSWLRSTPARGRARYAAPLCKPPLGAAG